MSALRFLIAATGWLACAASAAESPRMTAYEKSQGWRLLFDGVSFTGWHGFGQNRITANWRVDDGALSCVEEGRALVTDETYENFELTFTWQVADGGRAEVYFRLSEDAELPSYTGPVFQLAGEDSEAGGDGGLTAPWRKTRVEPGVWQTAKLVVFGNQVEHWIGGAQVSGYMLDSAEWRSALAASRFHDRKDYGRLRSGGIALAGRGARFRDIKVRPI